MNCDKPESTGIRNANVRPKPGSCDIFTPKNVFICSRLAWLFAITSLKAGNASFNLSQFSALNLLISVIAILTLVQSTFSPNCFIVSVYPSTAIIPPLSVRNAIKRFFNCEM